MIKYDLVKRTAEFNHRGRREVKQGCTATILERKNKEDYIKLTTVLERRK